MGVQSTLSVAADGYLCPGPFLPLSIASSGYLCLVVVIEEPDQAGGYGTSRTVGDSKLRKRRQRLLREDEEIVSIFMVATIYGMFEE